MDDAEKQIVKAMKEVMEKNQVQVGIKKSVKIMVTSDGEEVKEESKMEIKKPKRENPYSPKPGVKSKPKSYGVFLPKK
jgi:20S proteasome alpha/beta subunit